MMIYNCGDTFDIIKFLDNFYEELQGNSIPLSEGQSKIISVSGGFAWTADRGSGILELLSHADEALYEMKKETKGHYTEYMG